MARIARRTLDERAMMIVEGKETPHVGKAALDLVMPSCEVNEDIRSEEFYGY